MRLTIYSKPGCHLCDEMKGVVQRAISGRSDLTIDEIDITEDPALLERHGLEVPVLLIDGKKVAKFRTTEKELRRMLGKRVEEEKRNKEEGIEKKE